MIDLSSFVGYSEWRVSKNLFENSDSKDIFISDNQDIILQLHRIS
jgi:hypothetical protein